jgi:signal transduction histidine kinase
VNGTAASERWPGLLKESLERLPDAAALVGPRSEVLGTNAAARAMPEGTVAHTCSRVAPGARCAACEVDSSLRDGRSRRWYWAVSRSGDEQGKEIYYEVTVWPIRTRPEARGLALVLWRDCSIPLRLEHHLIEQAEELERTIADRSAEAAGLRATLDGLKQEIEALRGSMADLQHQDRLLVLGRLVAGIAHEVHTPLGAILANADLCRRALSRMRDADARPEEPLETLDRATRILAEAGSRIERLVRTLRSFSRLDESPLQLADLNAGLEATLRMVAHLLGDRIRIVRDLGSLPPLLCRPDALNQVFLNLLVNAIQAIPGEGEVRVATRAGPEEIRVEIADTGGGIEPALLERIFEAGYTSRPPGLGTGLGLAISRRIVADHGGRIEVTSTPGAGSVFTVRLPAPIDKGVSS